MRHLGIAGILCLALSSLLALAAMAATPEQQEKADEIEKQIKDIGKLAIGKKYAEAIPMIADANAKLQQLATEGPAVKSLVEKLYGRLSAAHRVIAKSGNEVPDLTEIDFKARPGKGPGGSTGVSFTKDIAPIFLASCNNCHVANTRGGFNLGTYNKLMKGSEAGTVFSPGRGAGSRLIDTLESGDMPRGGGKLPDETIALITKWIDEGAKFDGKDPDAMIGDGTTPMPMERPRLEVVTASGNEESRFSRDIAPILAEQCIGCHGGRQPSAQLRLETFVSMLAGNNDGLILKPGDSAASLIVKKLKGTAGAQMPLNRSPLSPEQIALFEKWIAEGAKFDGINPSDDVEFVANVYKASVMTHDELKAYRDDLAGKNWRLSNPDVAPDKAETENFLLYGNVGEDRLAEIGKIAEQQIPQVAKLLRAPSGEPLFKGRMTLFAFNRRYDYSEFGQMVEKREIPSDMKGHFKFNVVDAYGCIVPPEASDGSVAGLVGQQVTGAYLQSIGPRMPEWFTQGCSWAAGAKFDRKDPWIKSLDEQVPTILAQSKKPDDFLKNELPPGDTAILNYSYASFLMSKDSQFKGLLNMVRKGADFEQAFQQAYGGTPSQLTGVWVSKLASGGKRRGR
ncbi:MAG: c-type cytochrome domain-containing protein [Pirellulales bacterium]